MTQIMTPSVMTDGQIDKAVATYRAMLCKHRSELGSDAVQHALGQHEYVAEQAAVLRSCVEAVSNLIIRHVTVNRTCTPMEAIDATGRIRSLTDDVVASMPQGEGDDVDVYFIPTKRFVLANEVPMFLAQYGLVPDPRAQAAVNEADPAFADKYPNVTQWGDNCYLAFTFTRGRRYVDCHCDGRGWNNRAFLSGVRK